MGRILAIDYGKKKTGLAVTDPLKIIANGLDTIQSHVLVEFLEKYFSEQDVELIVLGYSVEESGKEAEAMKYIKPFYNRLKNKFPDMPIVWMDERYTSKLAFRTMIDAGLKKKARQDKNLIDKVSATIILQSYLEQERNKFTL